MNWTYPALIAHRCGGALAPENTLAGLHVAARLGVKAVEFDVMLSADGVPVLIHDETLERTTNGRGRVADMPLATLQQLDAGNWHHPAFAGERIPTLSAALACCRHLGLAINLEIKPSQGADQATAEAVAAVLAGEALPAGILLSSFSVTALEVMRARLPDCPRALLLDAPDADWQEQLRAVAAIALHCNAAHVTAPLAAAVRDSGYGLACYTVNDAALAHALYGQGVNALFSDRPDLLS